MIRFKTAVLPFIILCYLGFFNFSIAANNNNNTIVRTISENEIVAINNKPMEEITITDVIRNEEVSPELRDRIKSIINKSHYSIDQYRTSMDLEHKSVLTRVVDMQKQMNSFHDFKEDMSAKLSIAQWMVISLSIGIICLTTIIIIMWRSVVNVNRNDVELIFNLERIKRDIKNLEKRLDLIETVFKKS